MKRILKTITIGWDQDNPDYSLCPGHVTTTVFNKAHFAEGWRGGGWIPKSDLRHEWWKKNKSGGFKKVEQRAKGAKPYTVMDW